MKLPAPALLVITDRQQAALPLETIAESVFAAGCRWLSLREKDLTPAERLSLLRRLARIAAEWNATIGVHDDMEAACAVPGAALHLPASASVAAARRALGPDRLIGRSAHAGDTLSGPDIAGLDYVTLSPIFLSSSKPGYGPALGLADLAEAVRHATVPIIALGGIQPGSVGECLDASAAGVAVMGEPMRTTDPARIIKSLLRQFPVR